MGQEQQNQGGGNKKKSPAPVKCSCGVNLLPKDSAGQFLKACYDCRPEVDIDVDITRGVDGWQISIETYINEEQKDLPTSWEMTGVDKKVIKPGEPPFIADSPGLAIIDVGKSDKVRYATFSIIGYRAKINGSKKIEIPAEKPKGFEKVDVDERLGFWGNLKKAIEGE
jgi:hypothetical protein